MAAREWNRNQGEDTLLQNRTATFPGRTFAAFILAAFCVLCPKGARAQARRIELADFAKTVSVSDPQISPDGKSIACALSRARISSWVTRNDRDVVLQEIATGARRALTHDRKESRLTALVAHGRLHRIPLLPSALFMRKRRRPRSLFFP